MGSMSTGSFAEQFKAARVSDRLSSLKAHSTKCQEAAVAEHTAAGLLLALRRAVNDGQHYLLLRLISAAARLDMSVELLLRTKLGRYFHKVLSRHADATVSKAAGLVVRRWRHMVSSEVDAGGLPLAVGRRTLGSEGDCEDETRAVPDALPPKMRFKRSADAAPDAAAQRGDKRARSDSSGPDSGGDGGSRRSNKLQQVMTQMGPVRVGEKVQVKFKDDGQFYAATVTRVSTRAVTVTYPETSEWDVWDERIKLEDPSHTQKKREM